MSRRRVLREQHPLRDESEPIMRGLWRRSLVGATLLCAVLAGIGGTDDGAGRRLTGEVASYVTARGDTLRRIGARFGVGVGALADDNHLSPGARLETGRLLAIDHRHVVPIEAAASAIVVNVPQRMLFFSDATGTYAFPVAVGRRGWETPLGPFAIRVKEEDPTWDVPVSIQQEARLAGKSLPAFVPPGPANPLGTFWLGLSVGSVGIHGTNAPASIYGFSTHGCVRLHPDDVAWLFPRVEVGMAGRIVYEPVLLARIGDTVFLEVHPDVYELDRTDPRQRAWDLALAEGLVERIDWARVDAVVRGRSGIARPVSLEPGRPTPTTD